MTRPASTSEPRGIAADCFYVLGMYVGDAGLTVPELHAAITAENTALDWPVPTREQVAGALPNTLARRGLVARSGRGQWVITGHGYEMLRVWCGDDEEDDERPVRVPRGVGWPA